MNEKVRMAEVKLLLQIADDSRTLQSRGPNPMTKFEAFRRAAAEIGEATSEEISAYIEGRFGIEITPLYIPLFQATLQFQKTNPGQEKSKERSCH